MLAVVTGANRGIGLELCRLLSQRGTVLAVCRSSSEALDALGVKVVSDVDVTQPQTFARVVGALEGRSIDLLVHNAGILKRTSLDDWDPQSIRDQLEVNAIAPLTLTQTMLEHLAAGAKVAMITSRMGSIADNSSGGAYGYRMSKAALNAGSRSLALDLAQRAVAVAILHPGYVKTDMTGHAGHLTPPESAKLLLQRIDELTVETSGTFWHADGQILPW